MALAAVGLKTHIWNNNLKSVLLLLGFPLLLLGMLWLFFYMMMLSDGSAVVINKAGQAVSLSQMDILKQAFMDTLRYGHWVLMAALVWFLFAWVSHTSLIRMAGGGRPVTRKEMPEIYNMLENLCILRGLAMPQFDIINSPALNAFASGISDKSYRITLTRGIIDALEPDELEGVIAHELTHIQNKDVRLLIISVIFVGMISFFAEMMFRFILYGGGRIRGGGRRNGGGAILIAMVVLAIGYVFAILIRFALSRKREYLADAGAVELTKNPDAMMRALLRISGKSTIDDMPADVKQMCIDNSANFMGLFATHPPIEKRVRALSEMTNTPIPELRRKRTEPHEKPAGQQGEQGQAGAGKKGPWER